MSVTEEQEDEILALTSIYGEDSHLIIACDGEEPGGAFMAPQVPPQNFHVYINGTVDGSQSHAGEGGKEKEMLIINYLPPITLNFVFPWDYPSTQAPNFTLSCQWLTMQQLSLLCGHLDEIWQENKGDVILFHWFHFLENEVLEFLGITSPLDLASIEPHAHTHSSKGRLHITSSSPCPNCSSHKLGTSTPESRHSLGTRERRDGCDRCGGGEAREAAAAGLTSYGDSDSAYNSQENSPTAPLKLQRDPRAHQECVSAAQLMKNLLEFSKDKEQEEFDRSTVECQVCFTERSGRNCMRFLDCGHAFCRECLRDYFVVQIRDGNVKAMNCPDPKCESQAYPYQIKTLVTIDEYERYDKLLLQTTLETMADVVYCPRRLCCHPVIKDSNSNMGHCPACDFAFCTLCKLSYHGPSPCRIKSDELRKLREDYLNGNEEKKRFLEKRFGKKAISQALEETYSAEWLEENARMCPYCGTQIQKTEGCNKMTCIKCRSYFCWICSTLLSRTNPYSHFNTKGSPCFSRLFEGVELDEEFWDDEEGDDLYA